MTRIALVISDVDGTLVTQDKRLTSAAIQAVGKLHDKSIGFTITSSRPPFGMRMLVEPLGLKLPIGAFNGSSIVDPALQVIQRQVIPESAVMKSVEFLEKSGVDVWLFTNERWHIGRDDGRYVAREKKTIAADPVVVADFSQFAAQACKIVGVSADPEKLRRCEADIQGILGGQASAVRSQDYYLDITPAGVDKGTFVEAMAGRLGLSLRQIVTIGDMSNDLAMFAKSGISFAMGNATNEVKAQASRVTESNENDGFAKAIDAILAMVDEP